MELTIKLQIVEIPTRSEYFLDSNICSCQRLLMNFFGLNSITENLNEQVLIAIVARLVLLAELEELLMLWICLPLHYRLRSHLGHSLFCNLLRSWYSQIWWKLLFRIVKRSVHNTRMRGWEMLHNFRTYGPFSALWNVLEMWFFLSINWMPFPSDFYRKLNELRLLICIFNIID